MSSKESRRTERLEIALLPDELGAVDEFRFAHRMPSRAAAARELLRLGTPLCGSRDRYTPQPKAWSCNRTGGNRKQQARYRFGVLWAGGDCVYTLRT